MSSSACSRSCPAGFPDGECYTLAGRIERDRRNPRPPAILSTCDGGVRGERPSPLVAKRSRRRGPRAARPGQGRRCAAALDGWPLVTSHPTARQEHLGSRRRRATKCGSANRAACSWRIGPSRPSQTAARCSPKVGHARRSPDLATTGDEASARDEYERPRCSTRRAICPAWPASTVTRGQERPKRVRVSAGESLSVASPP